MQILQSLIFAPNRKQIFFAQRSIKKGKIMEKTTKLLALLTSQIAFAILTQKLMQKLENLETSQKQTTKDIQESKQGYGLLKEQVLHLQENLETSQKQIQKLKNHFLQLEENIELVRATIIRTTKQADCLGSNFPTTFFSKLLRGKETFDGCPVQMSNEEITNYHARLEAWKKHLSPPDLKYRLHDEDPE